MNKTLLKSKKFKITAALAAIIICAGIAGIASKAQTEKRASNIKSKGKFDYDNGTVVMDASDLTYLADEIDLLEETYKKETVKALNQMNTYFMLDDSTTHNPDESNLPSDSASVLPFSSIIDGILASQSIPEKSYSGTAPGEEDEETGYISGATEENLSLGTAAWVDGKLIVGTGADNNSYYDQGNSDGLKHIYENIAQQESFPSVSIYANARAAGGDHSSSDSANETYNIPLSSDKFLYAVQFNLSESCSSNREGRGSGTISAQLKTVEGAVIGSGTRFGSSSDGHGSNSSELVVIDLLAVDFTTAGDHLILVISGNAYASTIDNADSTGSATLSCNSIVAKYK